MCGIPIDSVVLSTENFFLCDIPFIPEIRTNQLISKSKGPKFLDNNSYNIIIIIGLKVLNNWFKYFQLQGSTTTVVDEVSSKTANAFNSLIKVAEFFTEDSIELPYDLSNSTSFSSHLNSSQLIDEHHHHSPPQENFASLQTTTHLTSQIVQRSFNRNNLDLTSVLRTVLDYYESFFRHPCLQLKLEIFKSMLYLANSLFDSKHQYESVVNKLQYNFEWLNGFIQQEADEPASSLMPSVNELVDESILAIGVYGEALSRCCLQTSKPNHFSFAMSAKDLDRLNKMFENGFRANSMAIKVGTVQGLMYWLESIALGYFVNTNDAKQLTDHLCRQIMQTKDKHVYLLANARYISTLWSAGFYAIENCLDSIRDAPGFISSFIKQTYSILNDQNTPYFLFYQLYMGLERFLLSSMIPSSEINSIQRLLVARFYDEQKSLCLTSLTVTSLYASNQSKQVNLFKIFSRVLVKIRPF